MSDRTAHKGGEPRIDMVHLVGTLDVLPIDDLLDASADYKRVTERFEPPVWVERRSTELIVFDREPPADYAGRANMWKWDPSYPTDYADICANHGSLPKTGWHTVLPR